MNDTRSRLRGWGAAGRLAVAAALGAIAGGTAMAHESHMWTALKDLQNAQTELLAAAPDSGGHRLSAVDLVEQAIAEVQAGIASNKSS